MRRNRPTTRLKAFEDRLKAHSKSQQVLCHEARISRYSLWRRVKAAPWERHRGTHDEDLLFDRLARVLGDSKNRLLWLAGYNPFVGQCLTLRQMELVFEIIVKLVHEVKSGTFDGDLGKLSTIAAEDLAGLKRQTTKVPGDKRPPQEVLDAVARGELTTVGEDGDHGDLG